MNPFPIINDKAHAVIAVHTTFPDGGYKIGDLFVVQHGPVKSNVFVFEVLEIGPGGRATRTKLVSFPVGTELHYAHGATEVKVEQRA